MSFPTTTPAWSRAHVPLSFLLIPMIKRTTRKLWVDDRSYAERRYELRSRGEFPR